MLTPALGRPPICRMSTLRHRLFTIIGSLRRRTELVWTSTIRPHARLLYAPHLLVRAVDTFLALAVNYRIPKAHRRTVVIRQRTRRGSRLTCRGGGRCTRRHLIRLPGSKCQPLRRGGHRVRPSSRLQSRYKKVRVSDDHNHITSLTNSIRRNHRNNSHNMPSSWVRST